MTQQPMDAIYRYQRHIYDLTRKYYLLGRDQMIAELDVLAGGSVLEIGCGTGRNLIKIARAYPSARLFGLDISTAMLMTAEASIARAGLSSRITLVQGDATNFDASALFPHGAFDCIVMSYTLSMIPDWQTALRHAIATLVPESQLHIVDFGQQERLPQWFKATLFNWLAKFDVEPRADLAGVAAGLTDNVSFRPLHRGYAWSLVIDAQNSKALALN